MRQGQRSSSRLRGVDNRNNDVDKSLLRSVIFEDSIDDGLIPHNDLLNLLLYTCEAGLERLSFALDLRRVVVFQMRGPFC